MSEYSQLRDCTEIAHEVSCCCIWSPFSIGNVSIWRNDKTHFLVALRKLCKSSFMLVESVNPSAESVVTMTKGVRERFKPWIDFDNTSPVLRRRHFAWNLYNSD